MKCRALVHLCLSTTLLVGISDVAHAAPILNLTNSRDGDGFVIGSATTLPIFGADGSALNDYQRNDTNYHATFASPTVESFAWSYSSHDSSGSYWDAGSFVLNGFFTKLGTDDLSASGVVALSLAAGEAFGWYVSTIDSLGRGRLDVASSVTPTPEPISLILLGSGIMGILIVVRRRKRA